MSAAKSDPKNQVVEKRVFRMHQRLLVDVMTRQAGSLSKAGLELVMNAVDSGSTKCDVTITPTRLTVIDDGKGFVGREEIENCFETFGHPHDEGDATYGRFRMGRGQAFSYGRNRWKSNEFNMLVDIRADAEELGYDLIIVDKPFKGCSIDIELYEKLLPSQVDAMVREMSSFVKFAQIPVTINGAVVNTFPKDKKWTMETDDAYFDLKDTGTLQLYSLGVLVRDYPASRFGAGGTVVSKSTMDLNFARNDVLSSCKLFKRISATVRSTAVKESTKKKRLSAAEWEALANDVRVGDSGLADVFSTPMIKLVTGSMISFADLSSRIEKFRNRVAVAEADDHMADRLMQRGVALVIDAETISRFGYSSLKAFCAGVAKLARKAADKAEPSDWKESYKIRALAETLAKVNILERKDFGKYVRADYDDVPTSELNAAEKFALQVIQRASEVIGYNIQRMVRVVREDERYAWDEKFLEEYSLGSCQRIESLCGKDHVPRVRTVKVGISSSADAWTDGSSVIWINRPNLRLLSKRFQGATRLAELVFHEYLHMHSPSTGDLNVHNLEFYQAHHDVSIDTPLIGDAVSAMMTRAVQLARLEQRKPTGAFSKFEDQIAELSGKVFAPLAPEAVHPQDEEQSEFEPDQMAARPMM